MAWYSSTFEGRECLGYRTSLGEEVIWADTIKFSARAIEEQSIEHKINFGVSVDSKGKLRLYFNIGVNVLRNKSEPDPIVRIVARDKGYFIIPAELDNDYQVVEMLSSSGPKKKKCWLKKVDNCTIVMLQVYGRRLSGVLFTPLEDMAIKKRAKNHIYELSIKHKGDTSG